MNENSKCYIDSSTFKHLNELLCETTFFNYINDFSQNDAKKALRETKIAVS